MILDEKGNKLDLGDREVSFTSSYGLGGTVPQAMLCCALHLLSSSIPNFARQTLHSQSTAPSVRIGSCAL